jgi:uncharacterized BrkB/YihY/UPF0761 family membrane protein
LTSAKIDRCTISSSEISRAAIPAAAKIDYGRVTYAPNMTRNPATARQLGTAFVQALRDSFADNATQWAAAIAYYGFLSLFPLILAAVSLSAYFVSPDWAIGKAMLLLREFVPEGDAAVQRIIRDAVHNAHPYAGVVSLLILLVLGSRAFGAL